MASTRLMLMVLAAMHGLNHTLQMSLPPLYLSIQADLGIESLSPMLLLGTVYFGAYAVMTLPSGVLADKFNKKRLLAFGALLNSLSFALAALTDSYAVILTCMLLSGIGGGIYHPVGTALIAGRFKGSLGRALGVVGMGASVGLFGGPVLAGFLEDLAGWRGAFLCLAALGGVVSLAFWLVMPDQGRPDPHLPRAKVSWRVFRGPVLLLLCIAAFREVVHLGTGALTAPMSQMVLGFSPREAGFVVGALGVLGIISQPLAGSLSDRLGRKRTVFIALALSAPLLALLPHLGPYSIYAVAARVRCFDPGHGAGIGCGRRRHGARGSPGPGLRGEPHPGIGHRLQQRHPHGPAL